MAMTRPNEHERTLDDEVFPDLAAPLPAKAATGDPQEGVALPNDQPRASVDYGVTADEQFRPESLDRRLAREVPDVDGALGPEESAVRIELERPASPLEDDQ